MPVSVRIATVLQPRTGGEPQVECDGATVAEVLDCVDRKHPGFAAAVLTADGAFRRTLHVYVDDEDARFLDGPDTVVPDGAEVTFLAAAAGG